MTVAGAILECHGVGRTFGEGALTTRVLADVSLSFRRGEACVFLGPSGSGKTTLLSILGLLLSPTEGEVVFDGQRLAFGDKARLGALRRRRFGFVFQHAQLLPFLSIGDNVRIVARNAGMSEREARSEAARILADLGIEGLTDKRPNQASGGQRQRAAIARALVHRPAILLADEPTAALDRDSGERAMDALTGQAREREALLITVTHDTRLLPRFDRRFDVDDGRVSEA